MPDPRPRPRYRLALIGAFAAFSLALVALGVRLGTAGVIGGADRGPAEAGIEPAGAVVDLEPAPAGPEEVDPAADPLQERQDPSRPGSVPQGEQPRPEAAPPATGTPASPAPQPPGGALPVPAPQPAPAPVPPPSAPVPPPPGTDPILAPLAPVLDALLGGSGDTPTTP